MFYDCAMPNVECLGDDPETGCHTDVYHGSSGQYVVVRDRDGEIIRDDRPWQMTLY